MNSLYVTTQGVNLCYEKETLLVKLKGKIIQREIIKDLRHIILLGNISLSTKLISYFVENNIHVVFLTKTGRYKFRITGKYHNNARLRKSQVYSIDDENIQKIISTSTIAAKIYNQRILILRHKSKITTNNVKKSLYQLESFYNSALKTSKSDRLMGYEGSASREFFNVLPEILKNSFNFKGRNRRPPLDPVNALLSFGYSLLATTVESICISTGLDPYMGYLHTVDFGKPALALDIMEPFRPIIVDSIIIDLINHNSLTSEHFDIDETRDYPVLLTDEGRKKFIIAYEQRLFSKVLYVNSDLKCTKEKYIRIIELHFRDIIKIINGELNTYNPYRIR